ncbi:MAG TPA: Bax inhibitor-1/YccA family protein [Gemmatimonadales bacterium]
MAYKTSNPGLNSKTFDGLPVPADLAQRMTLQGTVNKAYLMLFVLLMVAAWSWSQAVPPGGLAFVGANAMMGGIGGLILALIIIFNKPLAVYLSLPYAACQGLVLGGLSSVFEQRYPGIVIQSVGLTFGVLASLLLAYTSRVIKVTQTFRLGVAAATGGIALVYVASIVGGFFGYHLPIVYGSSTASIVFSLVVVAVAAFNLVLDFDFIESGVAHGAPKYMEWYAAFGLLVTLVWLYMEILRLLSKRRR